MKLTDASVPFLLKPHEDMYFSAVAYLRPHLDLGWSCFCRVGADGPPPSEYSLTIFNPNRVGKWQDELLVNFYRESFHPEFCYGRTPINDPFDAVKLLEQYGRFGYHTLGDDFVYDGHDLRAQTVVLSQVVIVGKSLRERLHLRKSGFFSATGIFVGIGQDNRSPNQPRFSPLVGSYAEFKFRSFNSQLKDQWGSPEQLHSSKLNLFV